MSDKKEIVLWADMDPNPELIGPIWVHQSWEVCNAITHPKGYGPTRLVVAGEVRPERTTEKPE